jgi:large subunit ribosomal protein L7A
MLDKLKNSIKAVGTKQTIKALENGNVKTVYISKDADIEVAAKVIELCNGSEVEIVYTDSMKQLGKACDIEVGAATAAIIKTEN